MRATTRSALTSFPINARSVAQSACPRRNSSLQQGGGDSFYDDVGVHRRRQQASLSVASFFFAPAARRDASSSLDTNWQAVCQCATKGPRTISRHCATHPTVRAKANNTVNILVGKTHRTQQDARIKIDIRKQLAFDKISVLQGRLLQSARAFEQGLALNALVRSKRSPMHFRNTAARGS